MQMSTDTLKSGNTVNIAMQVTNFSGYGTITYLIDLYGN